jgi:hypothetical protein
VGAITLSAGGALLVGSAVVLIVRHGDIQSIQNACSGGVCPVGRRAELTSTRDRALVEGPVAIGLGIGGGVAALAGLYMLLVPNSSRSRSTAFVPWVDPRATGVSLHTTF